MEWIWRELKDHLNLLLASWEGDVRVLAVLELAEVEPGSGLAGPYDEPPGPVPHVPLICSHLSWPPLPLSFGGLLPIVPV